MFPLLLGMKVETPRWFFSVVRSVRAYRAFPIVQAGEHEQTKSEKGGCRVPGMKKRGLVLWSANNKNGLSCVRGPYIKSGLILGLFLFFFSWKYSLVCIPPAREPEDA